MKRFNSGEWMGFAGLIMIVLVVLCGIGWCMNAYKFVCSDFESPYKSEVVRAIGLFVPPVGGITGYMTIGDE